MRTSGEIDGADGDRVLARAPVSQPTPRPCVVSVVEQAFRTPTTAIAFIARPDES